jgi:AcrR family transcriptional regulator
MYSGKFGMSLSEKKVTKEELVKQFRTREILAAGRKVLLDEGYDSVTLERVAELAGISKGTIYLYFKNKRDLIVNVIHDIISENVDEVLEKVETINGVFEKIDYLIDYFFKHHFRDHQNFSQVFIAELNLFKFGIDTKDLDRIQEIRTRFIDVIEKIITRGKWEGCVRDLDAGEAARILLHMLEGYRLHYILDGVGNKDLNKVSKSISDFYIQGIKK